MRREGKARLLRGRTITVLCIIFLSWMLADQVGAKTRFVPQLGLTDLDPRKVAFGPGDGTLVLVVNSHGRIDVFDIAIPGLPVKITEIQAVALDASFAPAVESRDDMRIVSGGADGGLRLWTLDGEEAGASFAAGRSKLLTVAFSPNGAHIASGGEDGAVRLWTADGEEAVIGTHDGGVNSVAFSPDGAHIVSGGEDGAVLLWTADGEEAVIGSHNGGVNSVAFSPDGAHIVSGGGDGTVRLWPLDGQEAAKAFEADGRGFVRSVAFSTDGKRIVSGGEDGTVRLWALDGEEAAAPFKGHENRVKSVAFSPDGTHILSGGGDRTVRLWILDGMEAAAPFKGHEGWVHSVAFSPRGTHIVSGGGDGSVRLWTLDGKEAVPPFEGHKGEVISVTFSAEGTRVVSGGEDGTVRLWTLDGKEAAPPFEGHSGRVLSVAFSTDGTRIVSGGEDGTVRLWTLDGKEAAPPFEGHEGWVRSVAFSPDGAHIVSGGKDGAVRLWTLDGQEPPMRLEGHSGSVSSVAFSPDGMRIGSLGSGGTVRLWTLDGEEVTTPFKGLGLSLYSFAFSPDGTHIALGGLLGLVRLWTLDGKEVAPPFRGHRSSVFSIAFSPDGTHIVSGDGNGAVRLWALGGMEVASPFKGHAGSLRSIAFSPDGTRIVSGAEDGAVRLWTLDGKDVTVPFEGHKGIVFDVAFSTDGTRIVSADSNGTMRLWTLDGEEAAAPLKGHGSTVSSAAFSPDGMHIVSGGGDGLVRLWTLEGKEAAPPFEGHRSGVWSVAFSPDGASIVSGGGDGLVRLWTLEGKEAAPPFEGHRGGVWSVAFSPGGTRIVSGGTDGTVRQWTLEGRQTKVARVCGAERGLGIVEDRFVWIGCYDRISILDMSFEARGDIFLHREGAFSILHDEGVFIPSTRVRDPVRAVEAGGSINWGTGAVVIVPPERVRQILLNEWTFAERLVETVSKTYVSALEWHGKLNIFVRAPLWTCVGWATAILFAASCWVLVPHKLAHWSMPAVGSPKRPTWKWLAGILTLFDYLGTTRRPLKRWLRRNWVELYATNFEEREPVKEREKYCVLGHKGDIKAFVNDLTARKCTLRWITGVGGSGKSSLAFRMLREASRLKPSVPLPVLIDEDWDGSLTDHVALRLKVGGRVPTSAMVETLGADRRICLLIDSFSERGMADTVKQVQEPVDRSVFPAVVVTSRHERPSGRTWEEFSVVSTKLLAIDDIEDYVATYTPEDRRAEVRRRIEPLLGSEQALSPLFVRFSIEQAMKGPLTATSGRDLVLQYIEELREERLDLDADDMVRAAEIAARESTREGATPREIEPQYLRGVLVKEADELPFLNANGTQRVDPAALIEMLVGCGLLNRNPINRRLQFAYDPVAEYLLAQDTARVIA